MEPLVIQPTQPIFWYAVFYAAAFIVGFILLAWEGRRLKLPTLPWWLAIATTFLFFMVGTQVIRWGVAEWQQVLRFEKISAWPGRSVLGGILFFVPGLLLAKSLLRFKHHVIDAFALVFPVGMAIQRVGCFLAGCCFGTPTSLPWGVHYAHPAEAFQHQVNTHLIPQTSALSLPVHPVQLYDLGSCLLIVIILLQLRNRLKAPGNMLTASLFLYGCFRFGLEFVRVSGYDWSFFFTPVQCALMIVLPVCAVFIRQRERYFTESVPVTHSPSSWQAYAAYFTGLVSLFFAVATWLSPLEVLCFSIVLFPMLGLVGWNVFQSVTVPAWRTATMMLMIASFFMMNQTYPEYSRSKDNALSYWTVGYGVMSGSNLANFGTVTGPCGTGPRTSFDNNFSAKAIGVSYVEPRGEEGSLVFGVNGFWGSHGENYHNLTQFHNDTFTYEGISPYVQRNWKNFGLGVGFLAGNFTQLNAVSEADATAVTTLKFYPSANLRVGNLGGAFFEYRLANQFPSPFPALTHQVGVGIGMGRRGGVFRVGIASRVSFFLEPTFALGEHLILAPYVGFGGGFLGSSGDVGGGQISIGVHYKFARKEK